MLQAKQEVHQLLDKLPENISFDDIQYHIYVRQKISQGLKDVEDGHTVLAEDFDKRMSRWLEP